MGLIRIWYLLAGRELASWHCHIEPIPCIDAIWPGASESGQPPSNPRAATSPKHQPSHAGRLEDKSSLVRKEALRLLNSLLVNNPFGPRLAVDRYASSLQEHKAMLEVGGASTLSCPAAAIQAAPQVWAYQECHS